ncbi:5'-3' exoribonuclease 1-like [Paramacrobiotus metropolitanus]|uniref:5'-3' exoribonuclease 1-like n=1 Tax=Paramacrobiotus metropolitanus TaxID=2943436 RepID=UPI0024462D83|nr:5'-3' exoribonuclease 1-like [Paramacrobiotus metropolitanus]
MGVPKFYRWISERYPCLSSLVKEDEIPKFDNFYLDMNGIIHHCSHPNDADVSFRISEEEIFHNIFHYIEVLCTFIRPQGILYLAVDGVAPRAKMNQQRGRRFRSAKDAYEQELIARREGKPLPPGERFDSNCITPGTDFMERLDKHLQYMITRKISQDPSWRHLEVYYSSHLVPGEGEHKILDFIRFIRSQKSYNPDTRHCLYGLDADLVMLGLSVHEPFMSLLREEVKFGKTAKTETNPEKITFHLLHLSILRDYLEHEFEGVKPNLKFPFDLEKIIDDWILMGFLVGNDFIPHLPGLHINKNAFDDIYHAYSETLPKLDGYINEGGYLNLERFQKLLDALVCMDLDRVENEVDDMSWMEMKRGAIVHDELQTASGWDEAGPEDFDFQKALADNDIEEEAAEELQKQKVFEHKEKYYKDKLRMAEVNDQTLSDMACEYVRAIQWNLHYYYHGVPSWEWFYPYNYAPYVSDLKNFATLNPEYELGEPFKPFEQLMAVLPERSKKCLPESFHYLFSANSPIYDFYPADFATDLNGKANEWEAVVLVPFIDEKRLTDAVRPLLNQLRPEEKRRNVIGKGFVFHHSGEPNGQVYPPPTKKFTPINPLRAVIRTYNYNFHILDRKKIRKGRLTKGQLYQPGFPSLGFVPHSASLQIGAVTVFQRRSTGKSMVLTVHKDPSTNYLERGYKFLGKKVFVSWPHHTMALVTRVTDGMIQFVAVSPRGFFVENGGSTGMQVNMENEQMDQYSKHKKEIEAKLKNRQGIQIDSADVLYYCRVCVGKRYVFRKDSKVAYLEPQWSSWEVPFPAELVVLAPPETETKKRLFADQLFPMNFPVFVLAFPYYGCQGKVVSHDRAENKVFVIFERPAEPIMSHVYNREDELSTQYEPAYQAARILNLTPPIVSRLTGTVYARINAGDSEKVNIGFSLKASKASTEVRGYTKRVESDTKPGQYNWLYSEKVLDLLHGFRQRFPELIGHWMKNECQDPIMEEVYPGRAEAKLKEVSDYLKTLPTYKVAQQACGEEMLDDGIIAAIQEKVAFVKSRYGNRRDRFRAFIAPKFLYRYTEEAAGVLPDDTVMWEMYDRVVNIREAVVPLGLRGTVISITKSDLAASVYITVLFDEAFASGDALTYVQELPAASLLNITHGERRQWELEHQYGPSVYLPAQRV